MKAAIIGCGNIGTELAMFLEKQKEIKLSALVDANIDAAETLKKKLKVFHPGVLTIEEAIEFADLIIEAASPDTVKEILKYISLHHCKKKLLVISTGGLIAKISPLKNIKGCEIYIPSGAIAGLDAIKAVTNQIESLQLITTKPPVGLQSSPFVVNQGLKLFSLKRKKIIFDGNIFDAVKNFPQNINVAASLFIASQFKKINVSIIADPKARMNSHEIICKGKFGTIRTITENLPSKNPGTSYLAVLSAQSALRNIFNPIKTGC